MEGHDGILDMLRIPHAIERQRDVTTAKFSCHGTKKPTIYYETGSDFFQTHFCIDWKRSLQRVISGLKPDTSHHEATKQSHADESKCTMISFTGCNGVPSPTLVSHVVKRRNL